MSANVLPGIQLFLLVQSTLKTVPPWNETMSVCSWRPHSFVSSLWQIHRSKNKWKFHLKDGIMNLNGRDYVFSKAIGDAEWWRRRKKKTDRSRNSNSYQFTRYFNILPHPGTGFVSGNIWVFENSHKPKGPWGIVKGCVSSNTLQTLRNENPTGGRKACERNVLHPFVCRLFQASYLSPLREFT